jgi:hypothetical protein
VQALPATGCPEAIPPKRYGTGAVYKFQEIAAYIVLLVIKIKETIHSVKREQNIFSKKKAAKLFFCLAALLL